MEMMPLVQTRRRVFSALERHEATDRLGLALHGLIICIVLLSLAATIAESVPSLAYKHRLVFISIEWIAALTLTGELAARLWTIVEDPRFRTGRHSIARFRYLVSGQGLVDVVSIAPFWLSAFVAGDLKIVIVLRFFRFLKLARYSPATSALLDSLYSERRALSGCLVLLVGAAMIAAALIHLAEHQAQPDKFGTIPDALWWAIVTLGTVGYGDAVPVTAAGRLVASLTIFCGLLIVALPIGILASSFAKEVHRRDFLVTWGLVARIPLFSTLSATEVAEIMTVLRASRIDAGTIITRRGDPAHSMYLIVEGEITLRLKDKVVHLVAGQFFGEVAVLRRAKRSATATAVVATRLLVLDASDLHGLMERHPALAHRIEQAAVTKLGGRINTDDMDVSPIEYAGIPPTAVDCSAAPQK